MHRAKRAAAASINCAHKISIWQLWFIDMSYLLTFFTNCFNDAVLTIMAG
jgi:hypothetical protein